MTYEIGKGVPVYAKISELRYRTGRGYSWRTSLYAFSRKAIRSLRDNGIVTVYDLKERGLTQDDLEALPGIGYDTARRLLAATEKIDEEYRGEGFPWEITIDIPTEVALGVENMTEAEVREAISLNLNLSIDKIVTAAREARKEKLLGKIAELVAEVDELDAS